jgi:hypothetical protein
VDTTLFTKNIGDDLFIYQIYIDDIIFGSTNQEFCEEFGDMMSQEFEMFMIGGIEFLSWSSSEANKGRDLHLSK